MRKAIIVSIILLTGCNNTQQHVDALNNQCHQQLLQDRKYSRPYNFTRWVKCKQEKIMPIEQKLYSGKEKEIAEMYEHLVSKAPSVYLRRMSFSEFYNEWDRMKSDIGMHGCKMKVIGKDESQRCLDR